MRTVLLALALTTLTVGCKKKDPEPAPVAAAPAPAIAWSWGPATFDGSRAEGNTGALKVPFAAMNNSDTGFQLQVVSISIMKDGEKVCGAKATIDGKAPEGVAVQGSVEIPCEYHSIPEGDILKARATAIYKLGDVDKEDSNVLIEIPISR